MRSRRPRSRDETAELIASFDRPAFRTIPCKRVSKAQLRDLAHALGYAGPATTRFVSWALRLQDRVHIPDGTPIIVDESGMPHLTANKYLADCRSRGNKPATITKKASDLVSFLLTVHVHPQHEYATLDGPRFLEEYARILSRETNSHGVVSPSHVITRKCLHVAEYLEFAAEFEDRDSLAPKKTARLVTPSSGRFASLRPQSGEPLERVSFVVPKIPTGWEERQRPVVAIPIERIAPVIEQRVSVPPWLKLKDTERQTMMRFWLAVNIGFLTGARVDEAASLTVTEIEKAYSALQRMRQVEDREQCIGVMTTRTKGWRSGRMLCFHPKLLDACHAYIVGERAVVLRHSTKKSADHDYLFVNHANKREQRGRPISAPTLSREFSEAVMAAGFTITISGTDADGAPITKVKPEYTFRSLRRAIANVVNVSLGTPAAAVFLGHASSDTTKTHYIDTSGAFARALGSVLPPGDTAVDVPKGRVLN